MSSTNWLPKITGGTYIPKWDWSNVKTTDTYNTAYQKAMADYNAQMQKYLLAQKTLKEKGYKVDYEHGGVIYMSKNETHSIENGVYKIDGVPLNETGERSQPAVASAQSSSDGSSTGSGLWNTITNAAQYVVGALTGNSGTTRTTGTSDASSYSYTTPSGLVKDLSTGLLGEGKTTIAAQPTAQRKQNFDEFKDSNTLTYQAKTNDDFSEARQTLLDAGYVKVGTDSEGKEYYEKRV